MLRLTTRSFLAAVALILVVGGLAKADFVAYSTSDTPGNQNWPGNLGLNFVVNSAITVDALGAYDSGVNSFPGAITVGLFQVGGSSTPLAQVTFGPGAITYPTVGNYAYQPVTPLNLTVGDTYSIVAVGYGSGTSNGNNNPPDVFSVTPYSGSLITLTQGWYDGSTSLDNSQQNLGYPPTVFAAGSISFAAVPEPAGLVALSGIGVMGLIGLGWRRRK